MPGNIQKEMMVSAISALFLAGMLFYYCVRLADHAPVPRTVSREMYASLHEEVQTASHSVFPWIAVAQLVWGGMCFKWVYSLNKVGRRNSNTSLQPRI